MANARAENQKQDIPDLSKVPLESLEQGSPQYKDKKRIIKEEQLRKKNSVVEAQWIEYHHTSAHEKGGKVLLKKKMRNGNVHSLYLGRLKKGGKDAAMAYKQKGVEVTIGREFFKN